MKILKIFGAVVAIHLAALVSIFAIPGCSSSTKPPPAAADPAAKAEPPPVAAPAVTPSPAPLITAAPRGETAPAAPILFDPNAAASSASAGPVAGTVRFLPTRPNSPVAGALVAEPVKDVVPAATYVVKSGDSLWTIAKKHKLTVADLTAANGIAANANLQPGQKLLLPAKSGSTAAPAAAPAAGSAGPAAPKATKAETPAAPRSGGPSTRHVVRSGESLTTIARDYGVRHRDIAVANNITDPAKIRAGHELIIPLPAGKAAPPAAKSSVVETPVVPVQPSSPPAVPIIRLEEPSVVPAPKS